MKRQWIALFLAVWFPRLDCHSPLFPQRSSEYRFKYLAQTGSGFEIPTRTRSVHALSGTLVVKTAAKCGATGNNILEIRLEDLKQRTANADAPENIGIEYIAIPESANCLMLPFSASVRSSGAVENIEHSASDPLWSVNMKRAIAASLQMQTNGRILPGAFELTEPCLFGICAVEYSSVEEGVVRRSNIVPTLLATPSHNLWMSVSPNICTKDIKNPLIGNAERWYRMDEKGLITMNSVGSIEIHYHRHIFQSLTNFTLERKSITAVQHARKEKQDESLPLVVASLAWVPPKEAPERPMKELFFVLAKAADGLEQHGLRDTLLRDKLPLEIYRIMTTFSHTSLQTVHEDLRLGTSYNRETMLNIFMEALPQIGTKAALLLVRDLLLAGKIHDESTALGLIRRLPSAAKIYEEETIGEMESLLKLGQEHPRGVRHAAILAFSTLVYKAFVYGSCGADKFEEYVQLYFSRFTDSPDYADRLVWLMGLSNLQLEHVSSYLSPVISGSLGHSNHERFLAVWATMPLAHLYIIESHNLYWPILQNPRETLEMRVAAITILLLAEPTPHRLLSLHWFITTQPNGHLRNFYYTTIKSLEHTTFDCYRHLSKMAGYLSKVLKPPGSRFWATGNYLSDAADTDRDMGLITQVFSVADMKTDLPNILYFTMIIQNAGLVVADYGVYLKLQGLTAVAMARLKPKSYPITSVENLVTLLQSYGVSDQLLDPVHAELIIKHQGKAILAMHLNQTSMSKLTNKELLNTLTSVLLTESHINQQMLLYPTLLVSQLPSEIGTNIQTDTMLSSLTSIRGNLTYKETKEEKIRKTDVNFRTSSLALLSLTSHDPIMNISHAAEVAQVTDLYLPNNVTVSASVPFSKLRFTWLQPGGSLGAGLTAYSGGRIILIPSDGKKLEENCKTCTEAITLNSDGKKVHTKQDGLYFDCKGTSSIPEIIWQLINSHKSNANTMPVAKPLLMSAHFLSLMSVPAEGSCLLRVNPPGARSTSVWAETDIDFKIARSEDGTKNDFLEWSSKRTSLDDTNTLLSWTNGSLKIERKIAGWRLSSKITGLDMPGQDEWKACILAEGHTHAIWTRRKDLDISVLYGKNGPTCPVDSQTYLSIHPYSESKVDFSVESNNVSSSIVSLSHKVKTVSDLLWTYPGMSVTSLIAGQLEKSMLALNGSMTEDGMILESHSGEKVEIKSFWTSLTNYKEAGYIKKCVIERDSFTDIEGIIHKNFEFTVLGLADCSRSPTFAFLRTVAEGMLAVKLFIGDTPVLITTNGKVAIIRINEEEIHWTDGYQYPEEDIPEIIINPINDDSVQITHIVSGVNLVFDAVNQKATLKFLSVLLSSSCGKCVTPDWDFSPKACKNFGDNNECLDQQI